ncbi:MAG: DUF1285 domain-containing protein [Polyangiaceae bacterium]
MRPADHPEFFRLPPPEGRSRESSIVLDAEGRFFHEGAEVVHRGMKEAFASWIARHPDNGRYILNNGYDWSYFRVDDAPFQVTAVGFSESAVTLELSDGTVEPLNPSALRLGEQGALYAAVKSGAFEARFSRAAQLGLGPYLVEDAGRVFLQFGGKRLPLPMPSQKA